MQINQNIILASGSPRRQELLKKLGVPFIVFISNVEENFDPELPPGKVVEYLSVLKAQAVAKKCPQNSLVIGSDTVIVFEGNIVGKPKNEEDAKTILESLKNKAHRVMTGVAIVDTNTGREEVVHAQANVTMRNYSEEEIEQYVASGEPMDKAGGYAIQGLGRNLIKQYKGCYNGIIGLPLCTVTALLRKRGMHIDNANDVCLLDSGEKCPNLELQAAGQDID